MKGLKSAQKKVSRPDYKRTKDFATLDKIIDICSQYFAISLDELFRVRRGVTNEARKIAIYACRVWSDEKLSEIAKKFQCEAHSTVSNIVSELKRRLEREPKLRKKLDEVKANL